MISAFWLVTRNLAGLLDAETLRLLMRLAESNAIGNCLQKKTTGITVHVAFKA